MALSNNHSFTLSILAADITDYFIYGFNESLSILGADITDYFIYGFNESLPILGADITDYFNYDFNESLSILFYITDSMVLMKVFLF